MSHSKLGSNNYHLVSDTGSISVPLYPSLAAGLAKPGNKDLSCYEVYSIPEVGAEDATLFEHCRRAVVRGLSFGSHGLPLIGTGDWNDGMNLVGVDGKGESVWLAWFLVAVLEGMVELCNLQGGAQLRASYAGRRAALIERIEEAGWERIVAPAGIFRRWNTDWVGCVQ